MRTNLVKKFKPVASFDFKKHIFKMIKVLLLFELALLPLNWLVNLSMGVRIREVLENAFRF